MTTKATRKTPNLYNTRPKLFDSFCGVKDLDAIRDTFDKNGFVKIKNLFSGAQINNIRDNVVRYQTDIAPQINEADRFQPRGKNGPFSILGRMDHYDPYFARLLSDPRFQMLGKTLLGDQATARHIQFFNVIAGLSPPTPPHQDALNFRNLSGRMVNIWMPLSHVNETNGCLHYIPASHHAGPRFHQPPREGGPDIISPYRALDILSEVAVHAEPGDVLVHHGLTIHGSEENISGAERWALGFPYMDNFTPISREAWLAASTQPVDFGR